jgi:hypothetical protein
MPPTTAPRRNPTTAVARNVRIPFNRNGSPATGQQRLGGTLSLAVDRRAGRSGTVYRAWADQAAGSILIIHVRRSTDRGVTWSAADLLTVLNATNAALAINNAGAIGLLYQQLTGTGATRRTAPASTPTKTFDPYLGDQRNADFVTHRLLALDAPRRWSHRSTRSFLR